MSTTLATTPIRPGDNAREQLRILGIPAAYAARWAAMGPAVFATLWAYSGHTFLEAHRTISARRTIVDACLLDGGDVGAATVEFARTWEVLIQAVLDAALYTSLVKAVARDEGPLFEEVLRCRGFLAAGSVGSPPSIDNNTDHGYASVRGQVRWDIRPQMIPTYVRQKTDFMCGPASALVALAHAGGCTPDEASHGLRNEMELWRKSAYSLGVGPYGLAAALARRGQSVKVIVSHEGPLVGLTRAHAASPAARRAIHRQHMDEARALGVQDHIGIWDLPDLRAAVQQGNGVIVLVGLEDLNGEQAPHWIYVWGIVGGYALIHDLWNDEQFSETRVETWLEAITLEQLWESTQWEEGGCVRAFIIVHR